DRGPRTVHINRAHTERAGGARERHFPPAFGTDESERSILPAQRHHDAVLRSLAPDHGEGRFTVELGPLDLQRTRNRFVVRVPAGPEPLPLLVMLRHVTPGPVPVALFGVRRLIVRNPHRRLSLSSSVSPQRGPRSFIHRRLLTNPDRKSTRLNSSHVKISYA